MSRTKTPPTRRTEQLLTVAEVADLDQVSEKTVRRAISAGLLDAIRVGPGGRLLRIEPAAHAAYPRQRQGQGAGASGPVR